MDGAGCCGLDGLDVRSKQRRDGSKNADWLTQASDAPTLDPAIYLAAVSVMA